MQLLDWPFLDALQMGALAVLCINFTADALARRDRTMGWLALACLLVGARHAVLALGTLPTLNPDLVDRAQSLLAAFGFIALCAALTRLFPGHIPAKFPRWIAFGMLPNYLRNLVLPHPGLADTWMHHAYDLTYLVGCGLIITWSLRARQDGDPLGRRLFLTLLGVALPVVVEIAAFSLFDLKVRLSGLSLLILAMAIGNTWQWLVVSTLEARVRGAETEVEAWRNLIPGKAFRTDRPSPPMEELFGTTWADRIRTAPAAAMIGTDGIPYRIQSRLLDRTERLGWCERLDGSPPMNHGFLSGWTVGLGIDDALESSRLQSLLRAWGADVEFWGTVPPREGPYPSLLLWAREPSILAVWREADLLRRRPRWVQLGGPATEGPHVRLESGVPEAQLWQTLQDLLSHH